jgi:hypothetical protein
LGKLERQLSLLTQPALLDAALGKCRQLKAEIDSSSTTTKISSNNNNNNNQAAGDEKLQHLYRLTERADELMDMVPLLVERLNSLRSVHQELAAFAGTARLVSDEQAHVTETIRHSLEAIQRVSNN